MVEHVTLTDPNLHEPKGVASASAKEVYVADGSGSGDWLPVVEQVPFVVSGVIPDISTSDTVYIPIPSASRITKLVTVLGGAISTANAIITAKNSGGSTMGTITVSTASSAEGDVDSQDISTNNVTSSNDYITIETDGGSTGAVPLYFSFEVLGLS